MVMPMREVRDLVMPVLWDVTTDHERQFVHLYCDYALDRIVVGIGNEIHGIISRRDVSDGTYLAKFKERLEAYVEQWRAN